ncbi:PsiF family protein, partial [Salmonella enterica subsp. enterica serovar Kentucky]|nr:PsiF family protein [Salmonella enterica subsp. enterica serovar Kentucky]
MGSRGALQDAQQSWLKQRQQCKADATCNQQATAQALKGDARKTYLSDCLKNSQSAPGEKSLTPQQQK